jgi:cysteine desulfurase / selenocysteine lyase
VPNWTIRAAEPGDADFLAEMLAAAAGWRPNAAPPDVLADPQLAQYVSGWGRPGDLGVVASGPDGEPIGAAWLRRFSSDEPGFGFVDPAVPELSIAVRTGWRGDGVGHRLLQALEAAARAAGVPAISLSVERANAAIAWYRTGGFHTVRYGPTADIMLKRLDGPSRPAEPAASARPSLGSAPSPPAGFDLVRARRETPGTAHVVHLNNAGAALPPVPVLSAVTEHLRLEAVRGGYEAAEAAEAAAEHTYDAVATLLGCHRDEIAIIENATRAWDMAFYSIRFRPGDRILTARAEYASNVIAFLQAARHSGAVVEVIPDDEHGQVSVSALAARLDDRVRLVAITHVPTQGGLVNPAAAIGAVTRQAGVPYLLDACQSVGQLPVDVGEIGCDLLSATGRKFLRGPRGTGFLYVRRELIEQLEPPLLDLHAASWTAPDRYEIRPDARRFENWESYYAGKIGLGVAVDYALGWGLAAICDRVTALAENLRRRLADLPKVAVHDLGARRSASVSFTKDGVPAPAIAEQLRRAGINTSVTSAESARFDFEARGLTEMVRASVHYYNTEDELDQLCTVVAAMP